MKVKCQHSNFDIDLRVFLGWRNPRKYLVNSIPVCQDKITFQNCSENQNVHQLLSFYPNRRSVSKIDRINDKDDNFPMLWCLKTFLCKSIFGQLLMW